MALPAGSVSLELILDSTKFDKSMHDLGDSASKSTGKISKSLGKTSKAFKALKTTGNVALNGLRGAMKATSLMFGGSCQVMASAFVMLKRILAVAVGMMIAKIALLSLLTKQGMEDLIQYDAETARSSQSLTNALNALRGALASAFAPIYNTVIPILVRFIDWLTRCANAVAHLISALTGKRYAIQAKKSASGVGKAVGGIGKSAGKANKKAKELQRTLMGFDKINKLDGNKDNGGAGGGGGGGGAGGVGGSLFTKVPIDKQASKFADRLKKAWAKANFTWLGAMLADKINKGMSLIPWKKIKDGAWRIARSIGTFINGFVEKLDWGLLGRTVSDALLTMFKFAQTFLETVHWESIGKAIIDYICGIKWAKLFAGASRVAGDIAGALLDLIFGALQNIFGRIKKFFAKAKKDAGGSFWKGLFLGIWRAIKGIGKFILNCIYKPYYKAFKRTFTAKKLKEWGKHIIDKLLDGIKSAFKKVINWFKDIPSKIKNALGNIDLSSAFSFDGLGDLLENFSGLDGVGDVVATVTVGLKDNFSSAWNAIKDAWNGLKDKTAEAWAKLKDAFSSAWDGIKGAWNAVSDRTASVTTKLVDYFSSAWSKIKSAWNGVSSRTATLTVNIKATLAKGWNSLVKKLRGAKLGVIKSFGKKLPLLAQGGWVDKNTPQLAVVGDNRHEGEIVAPDSKLEAMAHKVASEVAGAGNAQVIALLTQLLRAVQGIDTNVYLDGKEIASNTVKRINQQTRTTGQFPLIV